MPCVRMFLGMFLLCGTLSSLQAFDGHQVTEGPLTLTVGDVGLIRSIESTQTVRVTLTNRTEAPLRIRLHLDDWVWPCRPMGSMTRTVDLPGHSAATEAFQFSFGPGAWSAHYPIHAYAEFRDPAGRGTRAAHAVRIIETQFPLRSRSPAEAATVLVVPQNGSLSLVQAAGCRPAWRWEGSELHVLPAGWEGSDPESLCYVGRGNMARGQARAAIHVHPPYRKGPGALLLEYELRLPNSRAIHLRFFNAIRDVTAPEPPSDGVTFRVRANEETVFERHTTSKVWVPGEADLSRWSGRTVRLRLEVHPGPRLDTTCDLGFWGDPVIVAGNTSPVPAVDDFDRRAALARQAVKSGEGTAGAHAFALAGGVRAAIVPGGQGIMDAAIAFGSERGTVVLRGFDVSLEGTKVGDWGSAATLEKLDVRRSSGRLELKHRFTLQREFDQGGRPIPAAPSRVMLTVRCWAEGAALRVKFDSDGWLTDAAPGAADQLAEKVYYGHGYEIVRPGKFQAGGGGHNLASSHVGCDFAGGVALLQACDTPPDFLLVDPAEKLYALHTHPEPTFTFVAGHGSALDCAVAYRPLYDKSPAPAVARKAGRFVFDIWGGTYREDAALLKRCFEYGLTNSLALVHVWQRWGYDYRLPDIFPPLPQLGTTEDLRRLGEVCTRAGALWGLHDNYIDFYPDAENFSYDHVTFDRSGQPRRAWLNEGREAQAYQFRPDHVRPFLQRNLSLMVRPLKPTASFVDVWTSINAFDYFDRTGRWHSKMETLRCWGEAFDQLRRAVDRGPTTSEAGSDQLIGWLDGADCQLMQLSRTGGHFANVVSCDDWEQVPWFDIVNHTRFSLHGVGYSDRYQGGRSREDHGIESDDYVAAEILTGHALMIDLPAMPRGAVRKYWLAQPFVEKVAFDEIASVGHDGGDLHRITVRWASGALAHVNRGRTDWTVEGRVLPPYGFLARAGDVEASIETVAGQVIEQSRAGRVRYVNARCGDAQPLAIAPAAERIEHLGGRDFRLVVRWQAARPAPKDLRVFYHFNRPTPGRYTDTEFYGGGDPEVPTSAWNGSLVTGTNWSVHVPEGHPLGDYDILCGLYDARGGGARYRLSGDARDQRRYRVGVLHVEGQVVSGRTNITGISLRPAPASRPARLSSKAPGAVDFGVVRTTHGLRLVDGADHLLLVPLPGQEAFSISLPTKGENGTRRRVRRLVAVDAAGTGTRDVAFSEEGGSVQFASRPGEFAYRLEWE